MVRGFESLPLKFLMVLRILEEGIFCRKRTGINLDHLEGGDHKLLYPFDMIHDDQKQSFIDDLFFNSSIVLLKHGNDFSLSGAPVYNEYKQIVGLVSKGMDP